MRFQRHEDEDSVGRGADLLVHVTNEELSLRVAPGSRQVGVVFIPARLRPWRENVRVARNRLSGRRGYDHMRVRVARYDEFWAISRFTQSALQRRWHVDSRLLRPPLLQAPTAPVRPVRARSADILLLGRLSPEKRLVELIEAFGRGPLRETHRLWLIGDHTTADGRYVERVLAAAEAARARVDLAAPRSAVLEALGSARFLWHGMGIGVDARRQPELVEHFGMAILEAMGWGCLPIAADRGGPAELLPDELLVREPRQFVDATMRLEALPDGELERVQQELVAEAGRNSWAEFAAAAVGLVRSLVGPAR